MQSRKPEPQTSPHFTSRSLGRRAFLRLCLHAVWLGMGGWLAGLSPAQSASQSAPQASFWQLRLRDGQLTSNTPISVPMGQPGSLMKLVTAAALLEDGLITADERLECRGRITRHGRLYRCQQAHGALNLREALGQSCNVYFAQAADRLSAVRWTRMARAFGLDQPAGKYGQGLFPRKAEGSAHAYALGLHPQLQPNAVQLLRMTAFIAGHDGLGGKRPPLRPATWNLLQEGMRLAVRQGTARALDPQEHWQAAAKTGTAPHGLAYDSWVIGYFPFQQPRYAFCLRAFSGTGQDRAVPLAHRFLNERHAR